MSSLESLIHSAAEAAAAEIGPADIPPLRLTGADTATPRSRHWWPTPLAAAASVAAVLAGLIFVRHAPATGHGDASSAAAARPPPPGRTPDPPPCPPSSTPPAPTTRARAPR